MENCHSEIDAQIAGDGVFLRSRTLSHLAVDDPSLRCIDLFDSPDLQCLDLRACRQPVHLTVRDCPRLERVLLPVHDEGACIHWDFGEHGATVFIEGSIVVFDCCLADGRSARVEARVSPYLGAFICTKPPMSDRLSSISEDLELVISLARKLVDPEALQRRYPKLRALHLVEADVPGTLFLHAPNLECVAIVESSSLNSIVTSTSIARLALLRCRAVSQIVNSGCLLRVEGGRAPELKLEGAWTQAHFVRTTSKLISGPIDNVSSEGCPNICPARISLANATNPLAFLPTEDCIRDPQWRALIVGWITRTTNRATILPALKLIAALVANGLPPEEAWRLRTTLAENTARRAFKARCKESWSWDVNEDLAFETYAEDLTLWLRCRSVPTVASYDATLGSARGALQIAALVKQANSPDREVQALCLTAACTAIARIQSHTTFEGTENQVTFALKLTIEALVPRRAQPAAQAILVRLPRFIASVAADALCLEALSALAALGLCAANVELLGRARTLRAGHRDLASCFNAAAFAPRNSDILAHIDLEANHA